MNQAQKFSKAYKEQDYETAMFIMGNFLADSDDMLGEGFIVLIFEDKSRAGWQNPREHGKRAAWEIGAGER